MRFAYLLHLKRKNCFTIFYKQQLEYAFEQKDLEVIQWAYIDFLFVKHILVKDL